MQNQELSRQIQKLDRLFGLTKELADGEMSIQSHWARYLCVLVSGFVENALKEIYSDYIKKSSSPSVAGYAIKNLLTLNNPKAEKVQQVAQSFKEDWGKELGTFMGEMGRKDAIDSVMNNRHQIAHGKEIGITIISLRQYFDKILEVVDLIETQSLR